MHRMERDVVHGVDEGLVFGRWGLIATVAFEGKVIGSLLVVDISDGCESERWSCYELRIIDALDGYTPLNTAYCEPVCAGETGYYSSLPLEW